MKLLTLSQLACTTQLDMFACVPLSAENMYLLTNAIMLWFIHHLFKD